MTQTGIDNKLTARAVECRCYICKKNNYLLWFFTHLLKVFFKVIFTFVLILHSFQYL